MRWRSSRPCIRYRETCISRIKGHHYTNYTSHHHFQFPLWDSPQFSHSSHQATQLPQNGDGSQHPQTQGTVREDDFTRTVKLHQCLRCRRTGLALQSLPVSCQCWACPLPSDLHFVYGCLVPQSGWWRFLQQGTQDKDVLGCQSSYSFPHKVEQSYPPFPIIIHGQIFKCFVGNMSLLPRTTDLVLIGMCRQKGRERVRKKGQGAWLGRWKGGEEKGEENCSGTGTRVAVFQSPLLTIV